MSNVLLDTDGFQVACWDIPLPWTPDDDLPPSSDFDFEPDWDAAFDRPFPEDREWCGGSLTNGNGWNCPNRPTRIGTKWPAGAIGST